MAKSTGIYGYNIKTRNEHLLRNGGKYALYEEALTPAIGEIVDVYANEKNTPQYSTKGGLLERTISNKSALGKKLNELYHRDPLKIETYSVPIVPSDLTKRYRGKYENYLDHLNDVNQLSLTNSAINSIASWDLETQTMRSVATAFNINDIYEKLYKTPTFNSMALALQLDKVGVNRHYSVAVGLDGGIITNVNNTNGKDTDLGIVSSGLLARTLKRAYQFNSTRNTKYITEYLDGVYGLNIKTIHNFHYLLHVDDSTGRVPEIDDNTYIKSIKEIDNQVNNSWDDYLKNNVKEKTHYSTSYNRYVNLVRNQYSVFEPYFGIQLTNGNSIDNRIPVVNSTADAGLSRGGSLDTLTTYSYNEGDTKGSKGQFNTSERTTNQNTYLGLDSIPLSGLLDTTQKLFENRKIGSLVGRFHTSVDTSPGHDQPSEIETAVSKYGLSHGRNLLTKQGYYGNKGIDINGYDNPYCRVWTYHHRYHRLKDTIRPFLGNDGNPMSIETLQGEWGKGLRSQDGASRLSQYGVLNNNGLVNIAPTKEGSGNIDIKNCMFSIENLAWKDVNKKIKMNDTDAVLSDEQIGPNGGRIMWFPPYGLTINENVSTNWDSRSFIGRGEKVYSYQNTTRTANLDFILLVDHPSIIDKWKSNISNPTEDNEQELLRFFAGCDTLDLNSRGSDESENDNNNAPKQNITTNPVIDATENGNIIFYVFFPNNYSGINDENPENVIDYLLMGENNSINIPNSINEYRGYEMKEGCGITENGFIVDSGEKWGYRIDKKYESQILMKGNYEDVTSYSLNANQNTIKNTTGLGDATCSLSEFYAALNKCSGDRKEYLKRCGANEENINKITRILENGVFSEVVVFGGASKHGYESINNELSSNRRGTVKKWLQKVFKKYFETITIGDNLTYNVTNKDVCSKEAKSGRFAKVVISYSSKPSEINEPENDNTFNRRIVSKTEFIESNDVINGDDTTNIVQGAKKLKEKVNSNQFLKTIKDKVVTIVTKDNIIKGNGYRYDYEKEYFEQLEVSSPFLHKRIVDKIKYFDPAFHSITPEGFNARLTFLHQCTRQGHTISASDGSWSNTAGNLSFGRPPVCILRLGDFFHTKVIINSISINYSDDGQRWDLNPEGIGVQPIFAKINMSLDLIGGSDLGAPVNRLQNAVSFNYYANTSVYDNRSDVSGYSALGKKAEYKTRPWTPLPNKE